MKPDLESFKLQGISKFNYFMHLLKAARNMCVTIPKTFNIVSLKKKLTIPSIPQMLSEVEVEARRHEENAGL